MARHSLQHRIEDHLYDHPIQRAVLKHGGSTIVIIFSAFMFAFGFRAFLAPSNLEEINSLRLVSGGVSGISQALIAFVELVFGHPISANNCYDIVYSVLYFALNVPIFILAWFGIGKRFAFYTLLNVGLASLFTSLLRFADDSIFNEMSRFIAQNGGLVTRALLAGICTGVSSAVAYRVDASAGGIDVIAYYIALKKSRLVGRYSVLINIFTVSFYTIISITDAGWGKPAAAAVFVATLFSVLYQFVVMFVIDSINLRNKKVRVEAVTEMADLGKILIGNLPHGATVVPGEGAFSGNKKYVFSMVVSSYEVKQTVKVIREADPAAFIQVIELKFVAGRFFLPPVR